MKDFVNKNKVAVIFLLFFVGLALLSGFYLKNNFKQPKPLLIEPNQGKSSLSIDLPTAETEIETKITSLAEKVAVVAAVPEKTVKADSPAFLEAVAPSPINTTPTNEEGYTLLINDRQYNINLPVNKTAYDLMLALQARGDIYFKGKNSAGLGFFVEEINGVRNNSFKNKFWLYYINGKSASVGVSYYILKPKDLISWRYETPQF